MNDLRIGSFVYSTSGHDMGSYYVVVSCNSEYVYLVDGKIRTLDRPKKKNRKHIRRLNQFNEELASKIVEGKVINEEIKRAIKLLLNEHSGKEVK